MLDTVTPAQVHALHRISRALIWSGIALALLTIVLAIAAESAETGRTFSETVRAWTPGAAGEDDDELADDDDDQEPAPSSGPRRVPVEMTPRRRDQDDGDELDD